jgi:hypothetical protein
MAILHQKPYPGNWRISLTTGKEVMSEIRRIDKLYARLLAKQPKSTAASLIGAVVTFSVADGKAAYVVVKDRPLTVQHVPIGDAWHVHRCTLNGLDEAEVRRQLQGAEMWQRLGRKKRGAAT